MKKVHVYLSMVIIMAVFFLSITPATAVEKSKLIMIGSTGNSVMEIQRVVGAKVDGVFGSETEAMVKLWQEKHNLKVDGIVGDETHKSILSSVTGSVESESEAHHKVEIFGVGLSNKNHKIEIFEHKILESSIGGTVEFGYEFKKDTSDRAMKYISGELYLGVPISDIESSSLKRGIATEISLLFNIEQAWKDNPFGGYIGVSLGHMSVMPVEISSRDQEIIHEIGEEGLLNFNSKAKNHERLKKNYADIEVGLVKEFDGMRFSVGYGIIHKSFSVGIKYNLKDYRF